MLRVALTGGIACGKSVVARVLQQKGCAFHSADTAAHELMAPGRPAWKKIVVRFGRRVLKKDGTIDRGRLGPIVFADSAARRFMNRLIHPLVLAEMKRLTARLGREGKTRIFVSEAALTIEAGYAPFFDKVVVVHCAENVQVQRLMERDGIGQAEARKKIGTQMAPEEKLRHADYVIDTSGSVLNTVEQTERLYAALLQDAELKRQSAKKPSPRIRTNRGRVARPRGPRRQKPEY